MQISQILLFVVIFGRVWVSTESSKKSDDCKGKWQLVFRGISGNGESLRTAFYRKLPKNCTLTQGCLSDKVDPGFLIHQTRHLTSPLIGQWNELNIIKVKMELYKDGQVVVKLVFDAYRASSSHWFNYANLEECSFTDIYKGRCLRKWLRQLYNQAVLIAQDSNCHDTNVDDRNYFWLAIIDGNSKSSKCKFTKQSSYPAFLYAPNNVASQFNKGQYKKADELAIYIKVGKYL